MAHLDDARFSYEAPPPWRTGGKQILHGSEYTVMENNNQFVTPPQKLDFEINTKRPVLCDLNTRFRVTGEFQVGKKAEGSEVVTWTRCALADADNVILAPCWWEILIRNIENYHSNYHLKTHDIPFNSDSHLNQFLYWAMDKTLKKSLCLEPCHPGNAVADSKGDWSWAADSAWRKYAATVFTDSLFYFHWAPLFLFPFHQSSNHVYDERPPRCVPVNYAGKIQTKLALKDNWDAIFKKKAGVTNKYRFVLTSMDLVVEEARLNPIIEKKLYQSSSKLLYFPGVTKIARFETVNEGSFIFQTKFESIPMPESVLIFALPKSVQGDNYRFEEHDLTKPFFVNHNIKQVTFNYGGLNFALKEPNFASVRDDSVDGKNLFDYVKYGPFGLFLNQSKLTKAAIGNGFEDTDFPHVYINLAPSSPRRSRLIPLLDASGSVLSQDHDFCVTVKCGVGAVAPNAHYVIYCIYTDVNMSLDLREKKFHNPVFPK